MVNASDTCKLECDNSTSTSFTMPVTAQTLLVSPMTSFSHGALQDCRLGMKWRPRALSKTLEDINCSSLDARFDGTLTLNCADGVPGVSQHVG
eukprot:5902289-Amphidinium_carterae.1